MFHKIEINQDALNGCSTIKADGMEIHGVRDITYHNAVDEIPTVSVEIVPQKSHIEAFAELDVNIGIENLQDAIRCIRFSMQLDDDFRKAVIASAKSAIDEVRNTNRTDITNDYDLARRIVDRIFFGEVQI